MFKIGDFVTIKIFNEEELKKRREIHPSYTESMHKFMGEKYKIIEVFGEHVNTKYRIYRLSNGYNYLEEWLMPMSREIELDFGE